MQNPITYRESLEDPNIPLEDTLDEKSAYEGIPYVQYTALMLH